MPFTGVKPITEDPLGYDPKNKFKDPVKYYQHREALVAEEHVKMAEAKLMQQELAACYKNSGVNFVTDCKELAAEYMKAIEGIGISRANIKPTDAATWAEN